MSILLEQHQRKASKLIRYTYSHLYQNKIKYGLKVDEFRPGEGKNKLVINASITNRRAVNRLSYRRNYKLHKKCIRHAKRFRDRD